MGATIQGDGGSSLSYDEAQIVIRLPRRVFGAGWANLLGRLAAAIGHSCLIAMPQRIMTQRSPEPDAPRWKQACLDALSWFLYLLKVSPEHKLVKLWQTIDWVAINRICAPAYANAHGGQHAWAPAQMVALLVLMFLFGVPTRPP